MQQPAQIEAAATDAEWLRAIETEFTDGSPILYAAALPAFKSSGIGPGDLRQWHEKLGGTSGTVAEWAETAKGDIALAAAYRSARVSVHELKQLHQDGTPISELKGWAQIGVFQNWLIESCRLNGVTAAQVTEARKQGSADALVSCHGNPHRVHVTWENGEPSWSLPDHDPEVEAVATAFGGAPDECHRLLEQAQAYWWRGRTATTPGAALQAAVTDDPLDACRLPPFGNHQ